MHHPKIYLKGILSLGVVSLITTLSISGFFLSSPKVSNLKDANVAGLNSTRSTLRLKNKVNLDANPLFQLTYSDTSSLLYALEFPFLSKGEKIIPLFSLEGAEEFNIQKTYRIASLVPSYGKDFLQVLVNDGEMDFNIETENIITSSSRNFSLKINAMENINFPLILNLKIELAE